MMKSYKHLCEVEYRIDACKKAEQSLTEISDNLRKQTHNKHPDPLFQEIIEKLNIELIGLNSWTLRYKILGR